MRTKHLFAIAVFSCLLAVASAEAQFGGWVGKSVSKGTQVAQASQEWTPEQEESVGREAAAKLVHIFGVYRNPDMLLYVNLVGNAVAQQAPRQVQYHFAILDTNIANAFAMPGGYVFVTRGALQRMKSEAELAGVLAHEVAHVDGRHLEHDIRNKKLAGIAVSTAAEEGSAHAPFVGSVVIGYANAAVQQALKGMPSPSDENAADKNGTTFTQKAGYDAYGLRNFLQTLYTVSQDPANQRTTNMFNGHTHPPFQERIDKLTKQADAMPKGGQTLDRRFAENVSFTPQAAKK